MSSNLKVNSLVPATGTEIGIGTTGGSIDFRCPATFGGNVTIGGTLTYDEVINIDSIGVITARSNIDCNGDLDVDGHTDLDNVSIAGVTTVGGDLIIPDYIKHLGDTNTMIGFPSNDSFSVTTNNVTRMTFTGNFIDLPDAGTFRFGGSNDLQIYHGSGGASNIVHSNTSQPLIISATGAGSIRFDTNSTSRLLIDSSGNVLVGTTDTSVYNNGDSASEGIVLRNGEVIDIARKGDLQLTLNRQTNDGPHIAFYRSGAAKHFISTFDSDLVFEVGGSSSGYRKHRFTSTGDILLGAHGSRIFDDSSGTNVVVDIYGGTTAGKRGILALGGRTGSDDADIGTIQFLNENNANATSSSHVQSKLVASIDVKSETTNSNASANSGSHLIFSTKAQNAAIAERLRIKSDGNVTISNTTTSPSGDFRMLTLIARSDKQASIGFSQASGVYSGSTVTGGYTVRLAGDGALELATHNSNIIALKATQTGNVEMVGDLSTNNLSGRNIVINGDMRVAQRATSASMSNHGNDIPACDRWNYNRNGVTATVAQVAEAPAGRGFKYSLKWTSTSAVGSLHPGNALFFTYNIERQDIQRLGYGSSNGKKATLSFWAKGSLAGKIGMSCTRDSRIFSANVDMTANTWQHHTITIPADTSTGFSGNDWDSGFLFRFCWGAGSNSTSGATNSWINFHNAYTGGMTAGQQGAYLTTNGSTFQITGVQLEIGSQSTPFEHKLLSEEIARCKRYYNKIYDVEQQSGEKPFVLGTYLTNSELACVVNFPKMRVVPSLDITNGTSKFMIRRSSVSDHFNTLTMRYGTTTTAELYTGSGVSGTQGECGIIRGAATDTYIAFDAEL